MRPSHGPSPPGPLLLEFVYLQVSILTEKYKNRSKFSASDELPDTMAELKLKFNIVLPTFSIGTQSGKIITTRGCSKM